MKTTPYPGFEEQVRLYVGDITEAEAMEIIMKAMTKFDCPDDVSVEDIQIDGPDEGQKLTLRIMKYKDAPANTPVVIDFHGGGWVGGDNDADNSRNLEIMKGTPCIMVGVNYRLSNAEVHFPAPHEDALCAYKWVISHAQEFGGDPNNVALYGTSAGGNIVAGLQLKLRDLGLQQPKICIMNCPAMDWGMTTSKKYLGLVGDHDTPYHMLAEHQFYPADGTIPSYYAFPSFCPDVSKLGPTMMIMGEYDPLRSEGVEYACRLLDAGVSCEMYVAPGVSHAFCGQIDHPLVRHVVRGICGSLRRAFGMEIVDFV